jgi:phosphoribosylformimino-5-aminoimidazole carboxamide ribotide isomerase
MLIPSIDLMGGRVVQLEQGERLALASADLDGWMARFASFPLIQLIDLDAAKGKGHNRDLIEKVCRAMPCQVGGGIRTPERARELVAAGAKRVIIGSSLFDASGVNVAQAAEFADAIGHEQLVAAVDSRGGKVVVHGWKTATAISAADAIALLEPFTGAFLYTHVDTEGLLTGLDLNVVRAIAQTTSRRVIAAGGIRSMREVDTLDAIGIDAVVGMAIYKGLIPIDAGPTPPSQ